MHFLSNSSLLKLPRSLSVPQSLNLQLLEFHPLLNSRVHLLKTDQANILNEDFQRQYLRVLQYFAEKDQLDLTDKLTLIYYLLLQERINEALKIFNSISPGFADERAGEGSLQYDYIAAYLDFYSGYPNFTRAREIIDKYLDYPVIGWRNLFYEMANQLAEYDGEQVAMDDSLLAELNVQKMKLENEKNADKEPMLEVKIQGKNIVMEHKNLQGEDDLITINFYIIDLEIFFSKKPFLSSVYEDFSYIKPTETITVRASNANYDALNVT